jgi:hypothetical protein
VTEPAESIFVRWAARHQGNTMSCIGKYWMNIHIYMYRGIDSHLSHHCTDQPLHTRPVIFTLANTCKSFPLRRLLVSSSTLVREGCVSLNP